MSLDAGNVVKGSLRNVVGHSGAILEGNDQSTKTGGNKKEVKQAQPTRLVVSLQNRT